MIDLSFKFEDKSERFGESIIEGVSLLGEKGSATVRFVGGVCEIAALSLENSTIDDGEPAYRFMLYLIAHLLKSVHRVEWRDVEAHHEDYLKVVADFDGKIEGSGRIRQKYTAGVAEVDGAKTYFVEKRKKVYVKKLSKPKEKPLTLTKAETGLSLDIADVQSWDSAEFGLMEYIVLSREDEKYWLFPYNESDEAEKVFNEDLVKDGVFSSEELDEVRSWAKREVADEKSELSRLFSLRREQYKARCKALSERRKEDEERIKANLQKLEG